MMRHGISTLAVVLPPSRQSEAFIALSELAAGAFASPDPLGLAATMAAQDIHGEQADQT